MCNTLQEQTLSTLLCVESPSLLSGAAAPCLAPASGLVLSADWLLRSAGRQRLFCWLSACSPAYPTEPTMPKEPPKLLAFRIDLQMR